MDQYLSTLPVETVESFGLGSMHWQYAFVASAEEVNGEMKKILWTLTDHKLAAIDLTGLTESKSKKAPCKVYKAVGLPDDVKGHFGAGWTFKKSDGSHVVYFANNKGKGSPKRGHGCLL